MIEIQTTEYLAQLLKDKKQLAAFPNVFTHLERLLDEGKSELRKLLIKLNYYLSCLYPILLIKLIIYY